MKHDIAFLHTARSHVASFERLASSLKADLRIKHWVDEDLLAQALNDGLSPELEIRIKLAMTNAAASGAKVVVCTCSSIASVAESLQDTTGFVSMRIDRAMANEAVRLGQRILLVAALESSLTPSKELIEDSARTLAKSPDLTLLHIEEAWGFFERGEDNAYLECIAQRLERIWQAYDVIVLAQASMAKAADICKTVKIPILSSPELGVRAAIAALENA